MDEEQPSITTSAAVVVDVESLIRTLREEATDQVRCVVSLDPKAPTIAFVIPDCGSEELKEKAKPLASLTSMFVDQVFRWTIKGNYEGDEDDDYDPSVA